MSGFNALDNVTGGFGRSDLIIVAGRPGMGKTSFALNIARNAGEQMLAWPSSAWNVEAKNWSPD